MINISISAAPFDAIAATMPFGSVSFEAKTDANGERRIWVESRVVDRLKAMRGPGRSYSDVILKLAKGARASGLVTHRRPQDHVAAALATPA